MLSGQAVTLHKRSGFGARLVEDVAGEASDEETEAAAGVLYRASFLELMPGYLQYDTGIWADWARSALASLDLPYKRYVLKMDILSRQLYVTENKIVYKATRPSYIPSVTELDQYSGGGQGRDWFTYLPWPGCTLEPGRAWPGCCKLECMEQNVDRYEDAVAEDALNDKSVEDLVPSGAVRRVRKQTEFSETSGKQIRQANMALKVQTRTWDKCYSDREAKFQKIWILSTEEEEKEPQTEEEAMHWVKLKALEQQVEEMEMAGARLRACSSEYA